MSREKSETVGSASFPKLASVQDAMEDHTVLTTVAQSENKEEKEVCGVCGSGAKNYHFGGLCCASCKAFFRRSIQSNSWEIFLCVNNGDCQMRENRRSCQACRFELCKKIGMEPSLVMSIEDRKALMLRKLEKKKRLLLNNRVLREKQQQQQQKKKKTKMDNYQDKNEKVGQQESNMDWNSKVTNTEEEPEMESQPDEVIDECLMIETLSQENQGKIEGLQIMLRKALTFPEFPKHYYEVDTDITEHLFFVFCKAMGKFFSFVPEFQELDYKDQGVLLKDAVVKSIFIFGAHQFQDGDECWPRRLLSPTCTFPTISLAATEKFIDDDNTFHKMRTFMRKFNRFFHDEIVTLLSLMIAVFDSDIPSIANTSKVAEYKEIYTKLLMNYLQCKNSSIAETLFTNELRNCLSEVKDLKDFFQKDRNEDEDVKHFRGKTTSSFSSSLNDLGEDPKMPPKKAFFERNKVNNSYHSIDILPDEEELKEHHNGETFISNARQYDTHEIKDEEKAMLLELPPNPYFRVAQDHNYQKANAMLPQTTLNDQYKCKLPEEEVQILACYGIKGNRSHRDREFIPSSPKLHPKLNGCRLNKCKDANILDSYKQRYDHGHSSEIDYQSVSLVQNKSPSLIIPLLRIKGGSSSGSTGMKVHHTFPNEMQIDSKFCCSRRADFDTGHQLKFHDAILCKPMASEMAFLSSNREKSMFQSRDQHFLSSRDLSFSPERAVPTLALKALPVHLPMNDYFEMSGQSRSPYHPHTRHVNIASETCMKHQFCSHAIERDCQQNHDHSPTALSCGLFQGTQSNRQVPIQQPMIDKYYNLGQLSTGDDQQLFKAAQSVLPPYLVKHLGSRKVEHL